MTLLIIYKVASLQSWPHLRLPPPQVRFKAQEPLKNGQHCTCQNMKFRILILVLNIFEKIVHGIKEENRLISLSDVREWIIKSGGGGGGNRCNRSGFVVRLDVAEASRRGLGRQITAGHCSDLCSSRVGVNLNRWDRSLRVLVCVCVPRQVVVEAIVIEFRSINRKWSVALDSLYFFNFIRPNFCKSEFQIGSVY